MPCEIPRRGRAMRYITRVTTITLMKFNQIPVADISGMVTRPLPNMTALGPVPDGSINAQEQAKVAGIIRRNG